MHRARVYFGSGHAAVAVPDLVAAVQADLFVLLTARHIRHRIGFPVDLTHHNLDILPFYLLHTMRAKLPSNYSLFPVKFLHGTNDSVVKTGA